MKYDVVSGEDVDIGRICEKMSMHNNLEVFGRKSVRFSKKFDILEIICNKFFVVGR